MKPDTLSASTTTARALSWRELTLAATTALTTYCAGVSWQAQAVSYPLFGQVSAADFPAYHLAYNDSILLPVIIPGFVSFLASAFLPLTKPSDVPRPRAVLISSTGLISLAVTVFWAIPMHDRLDAIGQSAETLASLLQANAVRTAALTVGATALVWSLLRTTR